MEKELTLKEAITYLLNRFSERDLFGLIDNLNSDDIIKQIKVWMSEDEYKAKEKGKEQETSAIMTISVVIILYRNGNTVSKLFSTKAQALSYQMDLDACKYNQMDLDAHDCLCSPTGIWKIFIEEIPI